MKYLIAVALFCMSNLVFAGSISGKITTFNLDYYAYFSGNPNYDTPTLALPEVRIELFKVQGKPDKNRGREAENDIRIAGGWTQENGDFRLSYDNRHSNSDAYLRITFKDRDGWFKLRYAVIDKDPGHSNLDSTLVEWRTDYPIDNGQPVFRLNGRNNQRVGYNGNNNVVLYSDGASEDDLIGANIYAESYGVFQVGFLQDDLEELYKDYAIPGDGRFIVAVDIFDRFFRDVPIPGFCCIGYAGEVGNLEVTMDNTHGIILPFKNYFSETYPLPYRTDLIYSKLLDNMDARACLIETGNADC